VAKKHKFKKNKKKFYEKRQVLRKIKVAKDELRKLGFLSKEFFEKVHSDELQTVQKMVGKLVEHGESGAQELLELFGMVDEGATINLRRLKDPYVQLKLHKIFQLLRLQHTKQNALKFKARLQSLHKDMSLTRLIKHMIDKETERMDKEQAEADSSIECSSSSESDSDLSDSDIGDSSGSEDGGQPPQPQQLGEAQDESEAESVDSEEQEQKRNFFA